MGPASSLPSRGRLEAGPTTGRSALAGRDPSIARDGGPIALQLVEQPGGVFGHEQQLAVLRTKEALSERAIDPGQERVEEASHVEQADRLVVDAELTPGQHLEEFLASAKAT